MSDMEICFESHAKKNRSCFKLPKKSFEKLNIAHCIQSTQFLLWNRFHLFAYNSVDLAEKPAFLELEFEIRDILITKNECYCVDKEGTTYIIKLTDLTKQRKCVKKITKNTSEINLCSSQINDETAVMLSSGKSEESYYITFRNLCSEFKLLKKYNLNLTNAPKQGNTAFIKGIYCYCNKDILKYFNLNMNSQQKDYIVFYSLDSRRIYLNIINLVNKQMFLTPKEVYHCPSAFNDIFLSENQSKILIVLQSGTLLILNVTGKLQLQTVHLCTGVYKAILHEDDLYFSDKITLWKLTDVYNSVNKDKKFEKLKLKLPNDFRIIEDKFISISFSNLLYCFNKNSTDYFVGKCHDLNEYTTPKEVTTSKEIIKKIIHEVEKKEKVDLNIEKEKSHTLAVALTTKRKVLETYISVQFKSFSSYREIIAETDTYTLVTDINEYLRENIVIFAITTGFQDVLKNKLIEISKVVKKQMRIHVTVKNSIFSVTNSFPIDNLIHQDFSVLIPISKSNGLPSKIIIQIIIPVKNSLGNGYFWTVLYSKMASIGAEHFINTHTKYDQRVIADIKLNKEKINTIAKQYAGLLVDFDNMSILKNAEEFKTSLKLSNNFEDYMNETNLKKYCSTPLSMYLAKNLNNDFLKLKQNATLLLDEGSANLKIEKQNDCFYLTISSNSRNICLSLRDFFDKCLNKAISYHVIDHKEYAKMESLRRNLKEAMNSSNKQGIEKVYEQFLECCAELWT